MAWAGSGLVVLLSAAVLLGGAWARPWDLWLSGALTVWALAIAARTSRGGGTWWGTGWWAWAVAGLGFGAAGAGVGHGSWGWEAAGQAGSWRGWALWVGPVLAVPAAATWAARNPREVGTAAKALLAGGAAWAAAGLALKAWPGDPLTAWVSARSWHHGVPFTTMGYHGHAGTLLALLGLGWAAWAVRSRGGRRWLAWGVVVLVVAAAAVNASRVGLVLTGSGVVAAAALLWWNGRRARSTQGLARRRSVSVVGGAAAAAVALLVAAAWWAASGWTGSAVDRLSKLRAEATPAQYPRQMEGRAAARLIAEAPWVGRGIGAYPANSAADPAIADHYFALPPTPGQTLTVLQHGPADALELPVDWGLLGVALLACPAGWALLRSGAAAWSGGAAAGTIAACGLGLAVVLVHGLVDVPLQNPAVRAATAVLIGLAIGMPQRRERTNP